MKKLQFSIDIKAPREKVWKILWDDATYRNWTSVFGEGSYAVTDWKEGSKVMFLSGTGDGMFSIIAKLRPNEFMSFKHLGVIKNRKEEATNKETETWAGAMENYTLAENGGLTKLTVDMDVSDDHKDHFEDIFPKALNKVKELSEN